ncbi:MAG: hypothetical protein BZY75_05005 [SAR202 cluster bacterium Io17-Chloro-G7]|nr:MAG: hypothetical protein BZY75_05005 [SAR202 cluster bacterium Io17-Chloro-G7]
MARHRNTTKAAQIQGLGQPTATTHFKKLDEQLGVLLFDRIKRPIMLTSDGSAVLELITAIVTGLTAMRNHLNAHHSQNTS